MPLINEINKRRKIKEDLIQLLNKYSLELNKKFGKITLILFGSYARGDFNLWSDVDIIIISDSFKNIRFLDRPYILPNLYYKISYSDIICWDYDEAKKMLLKNSWKDALKTSIIIRDDYNIFKNNYY